MYKKFLILGMVVGLAACEPSQHMLQASPSAFNEAVATQYSQDGFEADPVPSQPAERIGELVLRELITTLGAAARAGFVLVLNERLNPGGGGMYGIEVDGVH